jgi:hypothetical protein
MSQSKLGRIVARLFAAFAILMMVAAIPNAAFAEDPSGGELSDMTGDVQTGIQMQNVGTDTAEVSVKLLEIGTGSGEYTLTKQNIAKEAALNYYMPGYTDVPGGAYSLVATADQPIEAMVSTVYGGSNAAGNYTSVAPGKNVILPYVTRNWASQSSQITVQNASQSTDTVFTITIVGIDNSGEDSKSNQKLLPGKAITYNISEFTLSNNGEPYGLPDGFLGYAKIDVTSGDSVVVQSFIDIAGQGVMSAFSGVPADSSSTTLYAPLIRRNFYGDTGIQLVNTNATAANVTITYYTDGTLTQYDAEYTQSITVSASSSLAIAQAFDNTLPTGTRENMQPVLTNDGWFGVAKIVSNQPLFGVVNDSRLGADYNPYSQSTSNVATAEDAGTRFAVPLVRASFPAIINSLTTGINVMNTTSSQAVVSITYSVSQEDGSVKSVTGTGVTVAANGSGNMYQGTDKAAGGNSIPSLGDGWYGSAIIESTQPIVVLVDDASDFGAPVPLDAANYGALKLQ